MKALFFKGSGADGETRRGAEPLARRQTAYGRVAAGIAKRKAAPNGSIYKIKLDKSPGRTYHYPTFNHWPW
jgi:hypothetical protein